MPIGDQGKTWAPHVTYATFKNTLEGWYQGENRIMKCGVSRIWRETMHHSTNCYFCMVDPSERRTAQKATVVIYPIIPSSIAPVPHDSDFPFPNPPQGDETGDESNSLESAEDYDDPNYSAGGESLKRNHTISTKKLLMI